MEDQQPPKSSSTKLFGIAAVAFAIFLGVYVFLTMDKPPVYMGHNPEHHGENGHHGQHGTGHDEVNMPGLQGKDATPEESAELAVMFQNFDKITRKVTNLHNGIRTVTHSTDGEVMDVLTSHVSGMLARVDEGRDPQVFIQSPTLDVIFARNDAVTTDIEITEEGIVVVQTSDDPAVVEALQTHAAEVTDMADRGMQAVHEMMMNRQSAN
jgi:hypothetical protein